VTLRLVVDTERWRRHVASVRDATPGLVPVVKGNGYGFGLATLAAEAARLGATTLAVGTAPELSAVRDQFPGDLLVLTPWRPDAAVPRDDSRVVHTVGRLEDLARLGEEQPGTRVVVEVLTSMRRHGLPPDRLADAVPLLGRLVFEGWSLHLPLTGDTAAEAARLGAAARSVRPGPLWVSHVPAAALARLGPDVRLRAGTHPWLGDPDALHVEGVVLDEHALRRGERAGYRQRRTRRAGTLLVVAGGTSHGVALTAPTPAATPRQRAVALARGGLDAAGAARSPFLVAGRHTWFVEPPHMQCSMIWSPDGVPAPAVGTALRAQVRYTTVLVDEVRWA
jgi:hypothetical protein